jgi:hypothetical protein
MFAVGETIYRAALANLRSSSSVICRCGHCKTIHYVTHIKLGKRGRNFCRFPGCKCRDYERVKA